MVKKVKFKKGQIVRVWALWATKGGISIPGDKGEVVKSGKTVLVKMLAPYPEGLTVEVYPEQCQG